MLILGEEVLPQQLLLRRVKRWHLEWIGRGTGRRAGRGAGSSVVGSARRWRWRRSRAGTRCGTRACLRVRAGCGLRARSGLSAGSRTALRSWKSGRDVHIGELARLFEKCKVVGGGNASYDEL